MKKLRKNQAAPTGDAAEDLLLKLAYGSIPPVGKLVLLRARLYLRHGDIFVCAGQSTESFDPRKDNEL